MLNLMYALSDRHAPASLPPIPTPTPTLDHMLPVLNLSKAYSTSTLFSGLTLNVGARLRAPDC